MVSYKEIRDRIQKLWPDCKNVWLSDLEYEYPKNIDVVTAVVSRDHTDRLRFRNYTFDCDDFSLQLAASVSRHIGMNPNIERPWPFGRIKGRAFQHLAENHDCNICLLENEIYLIEPMTDEFFIASATEDKPFFVGMPG